MIVCEEKTSPRYSGNRFNWFRNSWRHNGNTTVFANKTYIFENIKPGSWWLDDGFDQQKYAVVCENRQSAIVLLVYGMYSANCACLNFVLKLRKSLKLSQRYGFFCLVCFLKASHLSFNLDTLRNVLRPDIDVEKCFLFVFVPIIRRLFIKEFVIIARVQPPNKNKTKNRHITDTCTLHRHRHNAQMNKAQAQTCAYKQIKTCTTGLVWYDAEIIWWTVLWWY